ncbi:MAG: STT3 domain-containing protein [Candidatus Nanohalobium sp.]
MDLSQYRKKAEHLSQPENFKKAVKQRWAGLTAVIVSALAIYIRYIPEASMKYLQALDPYMIYRMSKHLALSGSLPALDFTRYFPYATPIHVMNLGDIAIPAILYNSGFSLFFPSYLEFAQFYPALMGGIGVMAMYFLGKELFDRFTGVSAAFFLATLSGVMYRTSAGFFEKEPVGTAFMLVSMAFFTRAWKRTDWKHGIMSGLAIGIFSISWGGSKMLWLLYPLVVGAVIFIDEDIEQLIAAHTPTVLIGGFFATSMNFSRFTITGKFFLVNLAVLALLWSRYLVEEFQLLEENQLKYYIPSVSITGLILLLLSPLYSQTVANLFFSIIGSVTRSNVGVIAGTVAENQASSLSSMVSSLSINAENALTIFSARVQQAFPHIKPVVEALSIVLNPLGDLIVFISQFVNTWTFMLFGIPVMGSYLLINLAEKYGVVEDVSGKTYYATIQAVVAGWIIAATGFLASTEIARTMLSNQATQQQIYSLAGEIRVQSIIIGLVTAVGLSGVVYKLREESYKILLIVTGFIAAGEAIAALNVVGMNNFNVAVFALLRSAFARGLFLPSAGAFLVFGLIYLFEAYEKPELSSKWYLTFPLLWVLSNIYAAAGSSRLVFLAGFPASLMAGYMLVRVYRKLRDMNIPEFDLENPEYREDARDIAKVVLIGVLVFTAIFSGIATMQSQQSNIQSTGGSPSQYWYPALDYMENNTEPGSVMLSWWDYGYWFESIGRRPAVADGGNFGYYSGSDPKVNLPLADYLSSSKPEEWKWFLKKHSVDYIVLDRSMIGKYSAVSQIARESNSNYTAMRTLNTQEPLISYLQRPEDERVIEFQGSGLKAFAPASFDMNTTVNPRTNQTTVSDLSVRIDEPITVRANSNTFKIDCLLTDKGRVDLGNVSERRRLPFCAAERPAPSFELAVRSQSAASLVLVPEEISDSTLVRLYLMDGYGIDYVEKVPLNRFEYVKMWKVDDQASE